MKKISPFIKICAPALLGVLLVACGGGGSGTTVGSNNDTVTVSKTALTAGQSATLSARATMYNAAPTAMKWTVVSLSGDASVVPTIANADCAISSLTPPPFGSTTAFGIGTCEATLSIPATAKDGSWTVLNTATSASASISDSANVSVTTLKPSGFRVIESSTPVAAYVGVSSTLTAPFAINTGYTASNIKYSWTRAAANPTGLSIVGSTSATPTVVPTAAGLYTVNVAITADVNGSPETNVGTVFVSVSPPNTVDIVQAGAPQVVTSGAIVNLVGSVNTSTDMQYAYSWTQITAAGVPSIVSILNANATTANFVAPSVPGTYGFQFNVVKTLSNGATVLSSAQTSVTVNAKATPVFTVFAGNTQTVKAGVTASLTGVVSTQNATSGVTYAYSWTQVGTSPAVATISNANTLTASFYPPANGTYTFNLSVTATTADGVATASSLTQVVVGSSTVPFTVTANAGLTQAVPANAVITLTGTQTTQGTATGPTYAYAWTQVGASPAVVAISNANTLTPSFYPTVAGTYTFSLSVTATTADGVVSASSTTQVIVSSSSSGFALTANAGLAQSVAANAVVALNGTQSTQGDVTGAVYTWAWTQTGTSPAAVILSTPNFSSASFTPTVNGTYTFNLTITARLPDGTTRVASSDTQVIVGGVSTGFSVSAGDAKVQSVNLSGSLNGVVTPQGSFSNAVFTYQWSQVGSSPAAVQMSNATSLVASFIPTVAGSYSFVLAVTANQNGVATTVSSQTQVLVTP